MKITPIEIRQHTFEKGLRGYKSEDVDAFLVSLSQEWERVTSDYKMLKMQLELAENELNKLKEVEMTLFRTLKNAEETSVHITEQANKAGESYIQDAKQKADEILADARKRTTLMVQDAENQARYLKDNILNDLKALEHDFKALEDYKENLAVQIRTLASNAVDSVERFEKKFNKQNLKGKINEVSTQIENESKSSEPEPVTAETPTQPLLSKAEDLPPLIDREQSIPEAIPTDESLITSVDAAIEATHTESDQPALSAEPARTTTEPLAPEAVLVEPNTLEPTLNGTHEEDQPKKSGSFFDQI